MQRTLAYLAMGISTAAAACGADPSPPGDCTQLGCVQPTGAGTGSGTGSGTGGMGGGAADGGSASDGAAGTADARDTTTVTFTVSRTRDNRFSDVLAYTGPTRVSAVGAAGEFVNTGDAGVPMLGMLPGVATGPNWFAVEDPSGNGNILSTLEPILVEPAMLVPLRAIWAAQLMPLFVDATPWAPLAQHATLIVLFTRAAQPLSGVTIASGLPSGATAAYEKAGMYVSAMTNPDVATDIAGVAIVRDIADTGRFPSTTELTLSYRLGSATLPLQTRVAQDFVTWMTVEVP